MDAVITYVDCLDPVWQQTYKENVDAPLHVERFRDWGTLPYLLRGKERHMPFIKNVYLIVASESQVPKWASSKLNIVYHKDIIPQELLPTFNSTTIEMFIHRIPGLDEQYVYFNDDMFPVKKMKPEDFFINGKPRIDFVKRQISNENTYQYQSKNSCDFARMATGNEINADYIRPQHSAVPFKKSICEDLFDKYEEEIVGRCSKLRENKNFNQYLFADYAYYTNNVVVKEFKYKYFSLGKSVWEICQFMRNPDSTIMCINDSHELTKKTFTNFKKTLLAVFQQILPKKSKYET